MCGYVVVNDTIQLQQVLAAAARVSVDNWRCGDLN